MSSSELYCCGGAIVFLQHSYPKKTNPVTRVSIQAKDAGGCMQYLQGPITHLELAQIALWAVQSSKNIIPETPEKALRIRNIMQQLYQELI